MTDSSDKKSPIKTNMDVDEILDMMFNALSDRIRTLGEAAITYKSAELNAKSTDRLTMATKVLCLVAGVQAVFLLVQVLLYIGLLPAFK